jgi:dTDP-4-dehydrorhamnose reductase
MKKILVLGSNGMLGYGVSKKINDKKEFEVIYSSRKAGDDNFFDCIDSNLDELPEVDYIINCIGIIKPNMKRGIENAIKVNSLFPHLLSKYCKSKGIKLIHITTDCVFSGKSGNYTEADDHDALDDYGKSKSLGECQENSMVIRTSIIGEEKENFISLISWAKSMAGKNVKGFTNHLWNGITTDYFGLACKKIIMDDLYQEGLFHIFSKDDVSKAELLEIFNEKWKLDLAIEKVEAIESVNRTLRSIKNLNHLLDPPSIRQMIRDLD